MLEDGGEQQTRLKFCKRHTNADTRASTKGEVGSLVNFETTVICTDLSAYAKDAKQ